MDFFFKPQGVAVIGASANPFKGGGVGPLDMGTWWATHLLAEMKFMTLFSMLFGAGLALMTERRIRHLPVFDGDELVGFISIGDLVKCRIMEVQSEAEALRQYIAT